MTIRVNGIPGQFPILRKNYSHNLSSAIDALRSGQNGFGHLLMKTKIQHLISGVKPLSRNDIPQDQPLTVLTMLSPCLMFSTVKFDDNNNFQEACVGHLQGKDPPSYFFSAIFDPITVDPGSTKHTFFAGWGYKSSIASLKDSCESLLSEFNKRNLPVNLGWQDNNSPFFYDSTNNIWISNIGGVQGRSEVESRYAGIVIDQTGFFGYSFEFKGSFELQLIRTNIFIPECGLVSVADKRCT